MIAISILFYTHWKGSEISFLFRSSQRLFNSLTGYPAGYPANETGYPAGYRISKKAGYPASRISGTHLVMTDYYSDFCYMIYLQ